MKKTLMLSVLLAVLVLSACTSNGPLAITIVPAPPTATKTLVPTTTPTESPTLIPSPTPDLRVINTDPLKIILTVEEVDTVADYAIFASVPNYNEYGNVINPYANLACTIGEDAAAELLERTGLVTGWTSQYVRADSKEHLPSHIEFSILVFNSTAGPGQFIDTWDYPCEYDFYQFAQNLEFGEYSTLCTNHVLANWNDLPTILEQYRLAIRYKNIYLGIKAIGYEETFDLDFVYMLADMQMEKLENLPLMEKVTMEVDFTPGSGCE